MPDTDLRQVTTPSTGACHNALGPRDGTHRSGGSQVWGRVRRVALGVVVVLLGYYLVSLFQVWRAGQERMPASGSAEVIVVLGAAQYDGRPSPQLAARLDHGFDLWEAGVAPRIMVTGGKRPGDRFTEADAGFAYLVDLGVPPEAIVREDVGTNTYESLDAAADVLAGEELDEVVLVTDPYHSLRTKLIAEGFGLDSSVSPTPSSVVTGWSAVRRELEEAGGVAIGRLIGFDRLSDLAG